MLAVLVALCLQERVLIAEEFDREAPRDAVYAGWERVVDEAHPRYNTGAVRDGALRLSTLGGAVAVRHRGFDADVRLSYGVSVRATASGGGRASVALEWLGRDGDVVGSQETDGAALDVETPPAGAMRLRVVLRLTGGVRSQAIFDSVRLVSRVRLELRPVGRVWPVYRPQERIQIAAATPAAAAPEYAARVMNADGAFERAMTAEGSALRCEPLSSGAYVLECAATAQGAPVAVRRMWVCVLDEPLFDPPEPHIGLVFRGPVPDPGAIADVAGARHVAVALPDGEATMAPLARRLDTHVTAIARPTREEERRRLQEVYRWIPEITTVPASDALTHERAWVPASVPGPDLFALRTYNDLLGGARPADAPAWATGLRAFTKRGRVIVVVIDAEVVPPPGWTLVDPLRGRRPARSPVRPAGRPIFLVSPQ